MGIPQTPSHAVSHEYTERILIDVSHHGRFDREQVHVIEVAYDSRGLVATTSRNLN
jgi:hypothetical protein